VESGADTGGGSLSRRTLLIGAGAGAGLLVARGLGVRGLGVRAATRTNAVPEPDQLLRELGSSLTARQRELIVLPFDHPTRQITNTIAVIERPHIGTLLSPGQLGLVAQLRDAMLSARGRRDFAGTFAVEGRFEGCVLAIYGDPLRPGAQAVLQGGHLMLRSGGESPEGAALGGAIAYGHQLGNHRFQVEGNSFAPHGDAANHLATALKPEQLARAIQTETPHELVLQPPGAGAKIPGLRLGALEGPARERADGLLDTLLASYPEAERREALSCIEATGGREELHFAVSARHGFYADMRSFGELDRAERAQRGQPYWQVWRLEGPGSVLHFQGWPHVHAYLNVVRDPERANIGESLGRVDAPLEGPAMSRLLDAALRRATGEELAWHGDEVPGRFCPGLVTSGLAYSLDPFANRVVVATLAGRAMAPPLRAHLEAEGLRVEPERRYRVASIDYSAGRPEVFGNAEQVEASALLLRDALLAHLRAGALEQPG